MNTKLLENETLIREGNATYFNSRLGALGSSAGGKIYLTNQRLLFEGHGFNVGREAVVLYINDIINCNTGFPNTLTVLNNRNEEFKFSVSKKKDWQSDITKLLWGEDYVKKS